MNGAAISWKSQKQKSTATSTTEAEYMAACAATKEAVWLERLMGEIRHPVVKLLRIFEDNTGCIDLTIAAKNPEKSKHVDIQYHYTREKCMDGTVKLIQVGTAD